jgi:hypothetical protein
MSVEIIECEQGTPAWYQARLGIPTASEFKTLLGIKKEAKEKVTRDLYMRKLAGEILTGEPMDSYTNAYMERGTALEDEARSLFSFTMDIDPRRVGFIRNGNKGCSPDSLIADDGGIEIKIALPHIQIDRLQKGGLPPEHRAQVQGSIWVSERKSWYFMSYCPKLPPLIVSVPRDDGYIATLAGAVDAFNAELAALVESIRNYGQKVEAA